MKSKGQKLLAEQLGVLPGDLLPWLVYTESDIEDRRVEIAGRKNPPEAPQGKQSKYIYIFFLVLLGTLQNNFLVFGMPIRIIIY